MQWYMAESGSDSDDSFSGDSDMSDADAAALGMTTEPPEFYDPEADDKDEAWVHKMRRAAASDAILSCPLCFATLCIDCQQHAVFENQFRAMFVMNCKVRTSELVIVPAPSRKRSKKKQQQQQQLELQREAAPPPGAVQAPAAAGAAAGTQQQQHAAASAEQQQPGGQQPAGAVTSAQGRQEQAGQQGQAAAAAEASEGQQGRAAAAPEALEGRMNPVLCAVCDTEVGLRDPTEGTYHFFHAFASNS